jgi:hypothetical protein
VGVACLSTPFLHLSPRELPLRILAIPGFLICSGFTMMFEHLENRLDVLLLLTFVTFLGLGVAVLIEKGYKLVERLKNDETFPELPRHEVLLVRSNGDGASAIVAVGQLLSRITGGILTLIDKTKWVGWIIGVAFGVNFIFMGAAIAKFYEWIWISSEQWGTLGSIAVLLNVMYALVGLLPPISMMHIALALLPYGGEVIPAGVFMELSVETISDAASARRPRWLVCGSSPVIGATSGSPPWPIQWDALAAYHRRCCSSKRDSSPFTWSCRV